LKGTALFLWRAGKGGGRWAKKKEGTGTTCGKKKEKKKTHGAKQRSGGNKDQKGKKEKWGKSRRLNDVAVERSSTTKRAEKREKEKKIRRYPCAKAEGDRKAKKDRGMLLKGRALAKGV